MKKATISLAQTTKRLQGNQLIEDLQANRIKGGIHSDPPPFLSDNL